MNKKLTTNNKPYIEEAFKRLNENSMNDTPQTVYRNLTTFFNVNASLNNIPYELSEEERVEAEGAIRVMLNTLTDIICHENGYEYLS